MQATLQPNDRRTGATWVAATGAFLLVAAAAVFVAVRWDDLPDAVKLAVVGAFTGAFLAGGRALRRTLPATGDVLFHLGAFLLPVDLAGANLRLGLGWRPFLLAEGVLGMVVLGGLGLSTRSVVLRGAGAASMVVVAAGVAATTPLPAPLVLALAAAGAAAAASETDAGRWSAAALWATVAGVGPVLGVLASWAIRTGVTPGSGVLADLGLDGRTPWLLVAAGAAIAAAVLALQAQLREDAGLAFVAFTSAAIGAAAAWADAGISAPAAWIGPAAAFLVLELIALATARDAFWRRPASVVATGAELLAVPAVLWAGLIVAAVPLFDVSGIFSLRWLPSPTGAMAWGLVALAWLAADLRRGEELSRPLGLGLGVLVGSRTLFTTVPVAASLAGAVAVGSASTVATAVALVAIAAVLVVSGRPLAGASAAILCLWAPTVAWHHPLAAAASGGAGALVLTGASVLRLRIREATPEAVGLLLAVGAIAAVFEGLSRAPRLDLAPLAIIVLWLMAAAYDAESKVASTLARGAVLLVVAHNLRPGSPGLGAATAALATAVLVVDAVRTGRRDIGYGAALTAQAAVAMGALTAGLGLAPAGLVLCVSAVVWSGLAAVVDGTWRQPLLVAAGAAAGFGLVLAAGDPVVLSEALTVTGALTIAAGLVMQRADVTHVGGAVAVGGLLARLALGGVSASEAYVAPVALHLAVTGWYLRRSERLSSWVAYGPAVGLLGGAALAERIAGGAGWHAVLAGTVGVAAVVAGGHRRLAGPLFLGTALVVATTVHESLTTLVGVPTWGWLALGGSVLLASGIGLERTDRSPVETGRRLVDTINERFD